MWCCDSRERRWHTMALCLPLGLVAWEAPGGRPLCCCCCCCWLLWLGQVGPGNYLFYSLLEDTKALPLSCRLPDSSFMLYIDCLTASVYSLLITFVTFTFNLILPDRAGCSAWARRHIVFDPKWSCFINRTVPDLKTTSVFHCHVSLSNL